MEWRGEKNGETEEEREASRVVKKREQRVGFAERLFKLFTRKSASFVVGAVSCL